MAGPKSKPIRLMTYDEYVDKFQEQGEQLYPVQVPRDKQDRRKRKR